MRWLPQPEQLSQGSLKCCCRITTSYYVAWIFWGGWCSKWTTNWPYRSSSVHSPAWQLDKNTFAHILCSLSQAMKTLLWWVASLLHHSFRKFQCKTKTKIPSKEKKSIEGFRDFCGPNWLACRSTWYVIRVWSACVSLSQRQRKSRGMPCLALKSRTAWSLPVLNECSHLAVGQCCIFTSAVSLHEQLLPGSLEEHLLFSRKDVIGIYSHDFPHLQMRCLFAEEGLAFHIC